MKSFVILLRFERDRLALLHTKYKLILKKGIMGINQIKSGVAGRDMYFKWIPNMLPLKYLSQLKKKISSLKNKKICKLNSKNLY